MLFLFVSKACICLVVMIPVMTRVSDQRRGDPDGGARFQRCPDTLAESKPYFNRIQTCELRNS